jgi:SAM-dependent methyltransferase
MTQDHAIIGIDPWLQTPPGGYLLAWEQEQLDRVVSDVFGYHAIQLGWPRVQGLRTNRMPHRWLVSDVPLQTHEAADAQAVTDTTREPQAVAVLSDYDALPFATQSIDLVVLPHTLELARDAHHTLREVERVLVPEGRVVILGLNPSSLWGLRQRTGHLTRRFGFGSLFLPDAGEFIGYRRLRDWLRLLSFEVEAGRFGCYRPPLQSPNWLERLAWMDKTGDRWWPVLGAVYLLVAVKRVRGMRLIGPAWKRRTKASTAPAVATHSSTRQAALVDDE